MILKPQCSLDPTKNSESSFYFHKFSNQSDCFSGKFKQTRLVLTIRKKKSQFLVGSGKELIDSRNFAVFVI